MLLEQRNDVATASKFKAMPMVLAVCAGVIFCSSASAQSMFRCGNAYQDRPCDGAQQTKVVRGIGTGTAQSAAKPGTDAACAQRGVEAQKIVWAREAGAMSDQLLAKSKNKDERDLIVEVYRRRGTSSSVRESIEADCVSEKEKAAQFAALVAATQPPAKAAPAGAGEPKNADAGATAARVSKDKAARDAADHKRECNRLNVQLEKIVSQQRAGGSIEAMETLNQEKRDIQKSMSDAAC